MRIVPNRPSTTRRILAVGLVALLASTAAACGGGSDGDASSDGDGTNASITVTTQAGPTTTAPPPDLDSYPVTVQHAFGSTVVEEYPERIALVGITDQDVALALGVMPVMTVEWFGDQPGAIFPWAQDEALALGGIDDVVVLEPDAGYPVEKIAATEPDLIVGLYSGLTQDQYDALSKIAPTVAQPEGPAYGISWQTQTAVMGSILGRSERAQELIDDTEAEIAAIRDEYPELEGTSAATVTPYEGIYVYGSIDPRGRLLQELGMEIPAELDEVATGDAAGQLSLERADLLDLDAVVWLDVDAADEDSVGGPVYQKLGLGDEGRELFLDDTDADGFGSAISFQSVLSLPFLLERLAPMLAAAIDGDPDTKAES